jgi:hypothetical protein
MNNLLRRLIVWWTRQAAKSEWDNLSRGGKAKSVTGLVMVMVVVPLFVVFSVAMIVSVSSEPPAATRTPGPSSTTEKDFNAEVGRLFGEMFDRECEAYGRALDSAPAAMIDRAAARFSQCADRVLEKAKAQVRAKGAK